MAHIPGHDVHKKRHSQFQKIPDNYKQKWELSNSEIPGIFYQGTITISESCNEG